MSTFTCCAVMLLLTTASTLAQVLQIDQRADLSGKFYYGIRTNAPMGQTFTPASNAVGFVQLYVVAGGSAVLHANLREGGVTGPMMAQSRQVAVAGGFSGILHFGFATNLAVTASQLYCIEPIIDSGADCSIVIYHFTYPGGEAIVQGAPINWSTDMWFREGTVANYPRFEGLAAAPSGSGQFQAVLTGLAGQQVVVEASNDAISWLPIQTNTFNSTTMTATISNAPSATLLLRAFYPIAP